MPETPFSNLAKLARGLEATTKKKEKTRLIAEFLRTLIQDEIAPAVLLLVGSIFPEFDSRTLEVGWQTMRKVLEGRKQTTLTNELLTIGKVHRTLEKIAGATGEGSRRIKENLLEGLVSKADLGEVEILIRIIFGEMRIGVNEGIMLEGIAEAANIKPSFLRRALMLTGNLGEIARIAIQNGEEGLKNVKMKMFTPIKPMLASMSYDISEVLEEHGDQTAFEYKFDGARIQIHRQGEKIRIFSRRLTDLTESLPDIVDLVRTKVSSKNIILEGEAVAIGENRKPLPFQDLMRRFTRVHDIDAMVKTIPLELHLFDILFLDGQPLIDKPYFERWETMKNLNLNEILAERIITSDIAEVETFLKKAMEEGHEGLIAKKLDSKYTPGRRGKKWFKIKPAETLDLVIVAADWGYGRRTGWLSNYHLAARDGDEYGVIGKTFKGLTDEEFVWMTQRLQELKIKEDPQTVYVQPKVIVEVAFNEIQKSPKYKSGFALRFARITRIRNDKRSEDADSMDKVTSLYKKQFRFKAKPTFKAGM